MDEIVGEMMVNGEVVCLYNQKGDPVFLADGWALVDGTLVQVIRRPVSIEELNS